MSNTTRWDSSARSGTSPSRARLMMRRSSPFGARSGFRTHRPEGPAAATGRQAASWPRETAAQTGRAMPVSAGSMRRAAEFRAGWDHRSRRSATGRRPVRPAMPPLRPGRPRPARLLRRRSAGQGAPSAHRGADRQGDRCRPDAAPGRPGAPARGCLGQRARHRSRRAGPPASARAGRRSGCAPRSPRRRAGLSARQGRQHGRCGQGDASDRPRFGCGRMA